MRAPSGIGLIFVTVMTLYSVNGLIDSLIAVFNGTGMVTYSACGHYLFGVVLYWVWAYVTDSLGQSTIN